MNRAQLLLLALLFGIESSTIAQSPAKKDPAEPPRCSTERSNDDCQLTVDRMYPLQLPTIQMRPRSSITVVMLHPLPYETLTLDPGGAQGVAGTDQLAGFLTSAMPNLKQVIASNDVQLHAFFVPPPPPLQLPPAEDAVQKELNQLRAIVEAPSQSVTDFVAKVTQVYSELQEIVAPLPRPNGIKRPDGMVPKAPWEDYRAWRSWLLCELRGCAGTADGPKNTNLIAAGYALMMGLPTPPSFQFPTQDEKTFQTSVTKIAMDISALPANLQAQYTTQLTSIQAERERLRTVLGEYQVALGNVLKDLGNYVVTIDQTPEQAPASVQLGSIVDPKSVSPVDAVATKLLGRTVSFSVSGVNQVAASAASVPTSTKKAVVSISVLFADPKFEASAGVFFSRLVSRTFSNQTTVIQNQGAVPTSGDVYIAQTQTVPTVLPFVAANYRLGPDFTLGNSRRMALYVTGGIGLNAYNSSAEYAGGLSLSWRSVMFNFLGHAGREVELTQGEYVGEVWCSASPSATASSNPPKCSSPPGPSTKRGWTGAFAIGISVRVPTTFGTGH